MPRCRRGEISTGGHPMIKPTPLSLADALPLEMARVRDKVIPIYQEIGPSGTVAIMFMRNSLDRAAAALASCDVVMMIESLEDLRGYHA